jgi:hypothetical protein
VREQDERPFLLGFLRVRHQMGRERIQGPERPLQGLVDAVHDLDSGILKGGAELRRFAARIVKVRRYPIQSTNDKDVIFFNTRDDAIS